jgi:biotin/methionine sulfoxide reductase
VRQGASRPTATHWGNYEVITSGGRVDAVLPTAGDPDPSPIGAGMPRALDHASRLRQPMVRSGWLEHGPRAGGNRRGAEAFVPLPWDDALSLAAGELERVKTAHGPAAIYGGSYGWSSAGRFHHAQSQVHRFLAQNGGYTDSINSYSCAAMEVILPYVIGGRGSSMFGSTPQWEEIAEHTELLVAFGGLALKNTQTNAGGVGAHTARQWRRRCREAGVRFVNVSPLRDDAEPDAEWLALRPNTDVALMLGLAHTILDEELADEAFLARCCVGFETFRAYVVGEADGIPKDARWAAGVTGLDAAVIRGLALDIASRRTLIALSWSLQRADHGEQPYWMGVTLAAMSGSMGLPGGGIGIGYGTVSSIGVERSRQWIAAVPRPANAVRQAIPVARIADMLLEPGATYDYDGDRHAYPDIRLVYWCGGNPFHHHQDLNRLVRAWQRPETVIVHESWWTATARFADIVLPAATTFERNDFAAGTQDPWITPMHRATDPPGEALTDYEIFARLAARLGFGADFTEGRDADEWVRHLYESTRTSLAETGVALPPFDVFWAGGPIALPRPSSPPEIDFAALRANPQASPLTTPSGRIEIVSERIAGYCYDDCPPHATWLEPAEWLGSPVSRRFGLHLISNQPRTRLHSQYDAGDYSQSSKIAGREPLSMHPVDAAARQLADGDVVRVFNDRGACLAGVRVTDAIRPGVVVLATGAWYDPVEPGTPGALDRHGNPNVLTIDKGTSRLAQGPSSGTVLVEVEHAGPAPPEARPFEPPEILS